MTYFKNYEICYQLTEQGNHCNKHGFLDMFLTTCTQSRLLTRICNENNQILPACRRIHDHRSS